MTVDRVKKSFEGRGELAPAFIATHSGHERSDSQQRLDYIFGRSVRGGLETKTLPFQISIPVSQGSSLLSASTCLSCSPKYVVVEY